MNQQELIKILLVGDYSIFRSALRMLIEKEKNLSVVGEAPDLQEAANLIPKQKPDLLLVDLPDGHRKHEFFTIFTQLQSNLPVLILMSANDPEISQKCLKLGTGGIVLKEKSEDILFKAIEKVSNGEYWFDRSVMGQTIKQLVNEKEFLRDNPQPVMYAGLSEREKQVVELICQGLKNKAIADKLFITETTVRHHLTSIFEKLGISSRLELVVYAFRNEIVKVPASTNSQAAVPAKSKTSSFL